MFEALGLSADYARGSTTDVVGAIKDNRMAGYVKSGAGEKLDGSTMDIATSTDIKVLGLSGEQVVTLGEAMPDISVVEIPEGAADGIPAYRTWSFGVAVPSTLDEETAYKIVSAVMEGKDATDKVDRRRDQCVLALGHGAASGSPVGGPPITRFRRSPNVRSRSSMT